MAELLYRKSGACKMQRPFKSKSKHMDSINKNQEEKNYEDLQGDKAIKKLKALVKQSNSCFFTTNIHGNGKIATRPMSVQQVDDHGHIWFLSANDSNKNSEIQRDAGVQLLFKGSDHSDFLSIIGKAEISMDQQKIKELWDPILKTWFTEGKEDPRITVIKVIPEEAYYWDNKHGNTIAFVKMTIGAALGKTLDDSIEGELKID
jgi:general stress protein 26